MAEQQRLIELLKEKRQSVISHAVTKGLNPYAPMKHSGIEWLGDVPEHWGVVPLKRAWSVTDCKHVTADFVDEGIPLASIREVQSRYVDLENAKQTTARYYELLIEGDRRPSPGDLIFSRNATVGEVAQVTRENPPFAMGQDVCLLYSTRPIMAHSQTFETCVSSGFPSRPYVQCSSRPDNHRWQYESPRTSRNTSSSATPPVQIATVAQSGSSSASSSARYTSSIFKDVPPAACTKAHFW